MAKRRSNQKAERFATLLAMPGARLVHRAPAHPSKANGAAAMFSEFATRTAQLAGKPLTFLIAVAVVLFWAISGPFFGFSDTWQLVINTSTTIITFLMVFLIQNTQNRDTLALQLKLAELIIAMHGAKNNIATAEDLLRGRSRTPARDLSQARGGDARPSRAQARPRAQAGELANPQT